MKKPNFPNNLIKDIIGTKPTEPAPVDIVGTVYYMICTLLNETQMDVIIRYYTTEASLPNIAKSMELTPERIRQIRNNALRRLRNIKTHDMLNQGLAAFYENEKEIAAKYAYDKGRSEKPSPEPIVTKEYKKCKDVRDPIQNTDLSVRSFNGLKRAGFNTVLDVINASPDKIIKVHSIGQKSYNEIVEKLISDYGEDSHKWLNPASQTENK